MTLEQFVAEWNGKKNNFDGVYENQCVDIVKQYVQDVLNLPIWSGEPRYYGSIADKRFFEFHANTPLYIPRAGSIAIWNGNVGRGFGHVGIVTSANLLKFVSFDQNWPELSPCILVNHTYQSVTGFLYPRGMDILSQYNALVSEINSLQAKYRVLSA